MGERTTLHEGNIPKRLLALDTVTKGEWGGEGYWVGGIEGIVWR